MSVLRAVARSSARRNGRRSSSTSTGPIDALFSSATDALITLPPSLGLSYSASLVGLAVALKLGISLPLSLWARGRNGRLQRLALPELRAHMAVAAPSIKKESLRLRRTLQQFKAEINREVKKKRSELMRKHRCRMLPTIATPFILNSIAFISTTLTIRQACMTSTSEQVGDLTDFIASGRGGSLLTEPNMDLLNLSNGVDPLSPLAAESFAWCTSLVATDPTMMLPLAVGLASFVNTELNATARQRAVSATIVQPSEAQSLGPVSSSSTSARRPTARRSASTAAAAPVKMSSDAAVSTASSVISNALRTFSVAFIVIAVNAPSAIVVYWLSSHSMNVAQTLLLRHLDSKRVQQ